MIALVVAALVAAVASGAGGFLAGKRRRPAPRLRPCSCEHGYGMHDKAGCHDTDVVTLERQEPPYPSASFTRTVSEDRIEPCGCKRFDGEVPTDMIGREFLHTGGDE